MMHPRISLHQVAMLDEPTSAFIAHCRSVGIGKVTLAAPLLMQSSGLEQATAALASGGISVACVNHSFAVHPDLERDAGDAGRNLDTAIDIAARLGASSIYLLSGGRGALDWEAGAARFASLLAPCQDHARQLGVRLLVESASPLNADFHMAHTLGDAVALAQAADIGVCLDLHACWFESRLRERIAHAMPLVGLVQVSDYVLGDRTTPCRAVPGDGVIPLERAISDILDLGYNGVFDLELVGPRIAAEGAVAASTRAAERLTDILTRLGA